MFALRQIAAILLVPLALILTAVWLAESGLVAADPARDFGLGLSVLGLVLATWYGRGRAAVVFLIVAASLWAFTALLPPGPPGREDAYGQVLFAALACLVPLNVAALAWLPERSVTSSAGLRRLAALLAQAAIVAAVMTGAADWRSVAEILHLRLLPQEFDAWTYLPQPAIWFYGMASMALLVLTLRARAPIDAGLLIALGGLALAQHSVAEPAASALFHAAAAAALLSAVAHDSYRMAFVDELTGLANRRALTATLRGLPSTYALAMVDVDHFKKFNDTYGHDVGDQVLKMVAGCLANVRGGGRAFRYGGEEFIIVFPGKSAEAAEPLLEKMRQEVAAAAFLLRAGNRPSERPKQPRKETAAKQVGVTVSIGLAARSENAKRADDVVKAADQALYRAKKAGRDRIER